jgi:hypothetical protein
MAHRAGSAFHAATFAYANLSPKVTSSLQSNVGRGLDLEAGGLVRGRGRAGKNDKHEEYAHSAAHCLEMVPSAPDQVFWPFNAKWRRNG